MAKYRIKQTADKEFYVQEKKYFFWRWEYVDKDLDYTWRVNWWSHKYQSLEDALQEVNARKDYLKNKEIENKEKKKYPIFHKVTN